MPRFFNTTNSPVVYNDEGQFVGGGEWLDTDQTDDIKSLVDRGYLVDLTAEEPEQDSEEADGDTPKRNTRTNSKK